MSRSAPPPPNQPMISHKVQSKTLCTEIPSRWGTKKQQKAVTAGIYNVIVVISMWHTNLPICALQ